MNLIGTHVPVEHHHISLLQPTLNRWFRLETIGGIENGLDDNALQFVDYAVWSKQNSHSDVDYWCKQLANAPTMLDIAPQAPRSMQQTFSGARIPLTFPHSEWQSLRQTFIHQGVSTAAVFLAAYCVVLHRLAEQDDILVGVPTSNRLRPELAQVIGYLSNMCVFRSHYAEDQSVIHYLQHIQFTLTNLIEHGETPLLEVLNKVEHTRQPGITPLFQVMFGYEQDVQRTIDTGELQLTLSDVDTGAARLDLSLFLFEDNALNVSGFLEYATDRIDQATAEIIAHMLTNVLRELVSAPQALLGTVPLGAGDSYQVAETLNATFLSVPAQIFALAESQPTAVALCDDRGELNFAQLRQQITQAAATLRTKGVKTGTPIAVMGERSISWVVTLLAIWQVGGIYIPLDPTLPELRLRSILAELKGIILIVDASTPVHFMQPDAVVMTSLWAGSEHPEEYPTNDDSEHSGYMMFTSGSTG
ncbi:MAG: condensation domain-containing protein, partial [Undibacterium sp.]